MFTQIKMLKTRMGAHDRYRCFKYSAGEIYDVPTSLAEYYVDNKIAEEIKEVFVKPVVKEKKKADKK